jgi:hypothetical protein
MVAVTAAMAAVAYAYFTGLIGGQQETIPTFSLRVDDQLDQLIVQSADPDANWNRLALKANKGATADDVAGTTVIFRLNGEINAIAAWNTLPTAFTDGSTGAGYALPINTLVEITSTTNQISATEYLDFEAANYEPVLPNPDIPAANDLSDVIFTLLDTTANAEIGSYTFQSIAKMTP